MVRNAEDKNTEMQLYGENVFKTRSYLFCFVSFIL
jgi:hypothetical protein